MEFGLTTRTVSSALATEILEQSGFTRNQLVAKLKKLSSEYVYVHSFTSASMLTDNIEKCPVLRAPYKGWLQRYKYETSTRLRSGGKFVVFTLHCC